MFWIVRVKIVYLLLFSFFLLSLAIPSSGQTFACDGSFYISLIPTGANTTTNFSVTYNGLNAEFNELAETDLIINATGYNVMDNYIYASNRQNSDIVRLFSDGNFVTVGNEPTVTAWNTGAGDCDHLGRYIVHNRENDKLYFYKVLGNFELLDDVELFWSASSGNSGIASLALDDISFDPDSDGVIYSYQRAYFNSGEPASSRGALLTIDGNPSSPTFGEVNIVGIVPDNVIKHLGAMFFDAFGNLYGYGSIATGPVIQERLILINKFTANASYITTGPSANNNDGCSCPFGVEMTKSVLLVSNECDTTTVIYEVNVVNKSQNTISGITYFDQMPSTGVISNIEPILPLGGSSTAGTGLGFSNLQYDNVVINAGTQYSFEVTIKLPSVVGNYSSQAEISGLSASFGVTTISDDPNTFAFNDPTIFEIKQEDISNDFTEQIMASICHGDSYDFFGNLYSTTGIYIEEVSGVAINGCDSIYQLQLNVLPTSENKIDVSICSGSSYDFNGEMYDSTGIYSNLLENANSNGCDSSVILNLTVSDTVFSNLSFDICPGEIATFNGVEYDQNGNYELFFPNSNIDGCDSMINLSITVQPSFDFEIESQHLSCAGDEFGSINLIGGNSDFEPYTFSLNGDEPIENPEFNNLLPGSYEVIVEGTNSCVVAYESIEILDNSASIFLIGNQSDFKVNLGQSVQLFIQSNIDIEFIKWIPETGLSCTDCLNPISTPLEDISYTAMTQYADGCEKDVEFKIEVNKIKNIYVPNAFSPNNDGNNDLFSVFSDQSIQKIRSLQIFDRWGELIFKNENFSPNDINLGWDGTFNGKPMNPAVFVYIILAEQIDGTELLLKGDITLLR